MTPEFLAFMGSGAVNLAFLIFSFGASKVKLELLEKQLQDVEERLKALPQEYVSMGLFRDFMNDVRSSMTEVRQDIKTLIGMTQTK